MSDLQIPPCPTCHGSRRWPTRLIEGQECVCHLGHGEQDCPAHVDWDVCLDCNGSGYHPDTINKVAYAIGQAVTLDDDAVRANPMMLHDATKAVLDVLTGDTE